MYLQSLDGVRAVGCGLGCRGDVDGGVGPRVKVRQLNDGERPEGGRGAGEERVVAQTMDDLEEDLEEEGKPVPERRPHLECPTRGVHLGLSQLSHWKVDSGGQTVSKDGDCPFRGSSVSLLGSLMERRFCDDDEDHKTTREEEGEKEEDKGGGDSLVFLGSCGRRFCFDEVYREWK